MNRNYVLFSALLLTLLIYGFLICDGQYHLIDLAYAITGKDQTSINTIKYSSCLGGKFSRPYIVKAGFKNKEIISNDCFKKRGGHLRTVVVLNKNQSVYSQIDVTQSGKPNTQYVIEYCFDLNDKSITIPENCELVFKGGSLNNGTVIGNKTIINAKEEPIINNVEIEGSWIAPTVYSDWFKNIEKINMLKSLFTFTSDSTPNIVYISKGNYLVSADYNGDEIIMIKSNTKIFLDGDVKIIPNGYDNYQIFRLQNKDNVEIRGVGHITGDRYSHKSQQGESGHGIVLRQSSNIKISGITITDMWGDGIAVGGAEGVSCSNILIDSCTINNARRNGISIVYADKFKVSNCSFSGNEGTSPERAIDIEPNPNCYCINGVIINNTINGKYGISTALEGRGGNYIKNIWIEGNRFNCHTGNYYTTYGRAITILGDPENVVIDNNLISNGGIFAGSSRIDKNIVIKNNSITGKSRFDCIKCYNNHIKDVAIQCTGCIFSNNNVYCDAENNTGNGETGLVSNSSLVSNNTFNLYGNKYSFDCPITVRKNSEVKNNIINVSKEAKVRYFVRVLSGTQTVIEGNVRPKELKVLNHGLGTIIND